jgi:hypothetical protein
VYLPTFNEPIFSQLRNVIKEKFSLSNNNPYPMLFFNAQIKERVKSKKTNPS